MILRFLGVFLSVGLLWAAAPYPVRAADTNQPELHELLYQARAGDSAAQLLYGLAVLEGRYDLKPDYRRAKQWLQRSAAGKNPYAEMMLGTSYAKGQGVARDPVQAVKCWRDAALNNNVQAEYLLGKAYERGFGISKDPAQAVHWLSLAAARGSKDAQSLIASMYHEGYGAAQDQELDHDWLSGAAAIGDNESINPLAMLNTVLKYTTMVHRQSAKALIDKAEQGEPLTQYELGMRYETGAWAVGKNEKLAFYWLNRSANNGNRLAMQAMQHAYEFGKLGKKKDPAQVRYWAKQLHMHAQPKSLLPAKAPLNQ